MSMVRHVPVRFENDPWLNRSDWFPRAGYMYPPPPPPSFYQPTWSSFNDPFPLETRMQTLPMDHSNRRNWHLEESRASSGMQREMQRMTDEMNKMMNNMQNSVSRGAPLGTVDDWRLTENFKMDNPIKSDYDGHRKFHLQFDVRNFRPEEINVKTNGNQLTVHARHEEKGDGKSAFREYSRQYVLPREVNPETLISKLSAEGMLTIEAPLPALEGPREKFIAIEHKK